MGKKIFGVPKNFSKSRAGNPPAPHPGMNVVSWCHAVDKKIKKEDAHRRMLEAANTGPPLVWELSTKEYILAEEARILELAKDLRELVMNAVNPKCERWYMITWAPPREGQGLSHQQLQLIHGFIRKNAATDWEYAIEQKGETPETAGFGAHVHYLVKSDNAAANVIRDSRRYFGTTGIVKLGDGRSPYIRDEVGLQRAKNYIRGEKHNASKDAACAIDIVWRKTNNWEPLYQSRVKVQLPIREAITFD